MQEALVDIAQRKIIFTVLEALWYAGLLGLGIWIGRQNIKQLAKRLVCKLYGHEDKYVKLGMPKCGVAKCEYCDCCDRCNLPLSSKP